ncbi:Uma2 family endonuclease [Kitasatospora cinereorecta]|uniref:Uma2 family endonuclease n=1 Tax=Kitasatospora cinereorecta TaxID=285560 RepID=A0ABW0VI43_9ACTN
MGTDPAVYARLRKIADQLPEVPGVGKLEIADGRIVMTTSPVSRHELAVVRIARQLNAQIERTHPGYLAHGGADLEDAGLGRLRNPDLMVFPEAALEAEKPALLPHEVLLVVEVVSKSNPENDYDHKVRDYAAMGIPLYLLVDPQGHGHHPRSARLRRPDAIHVRRHRHRRSVDHRHRRAADVRLTRRTSAGAGRQAMRSRTIGFGVKAVPGSAMRMPPASASMA